MDETPKKIKKNKNKKITKKRKKDRSFFDLDGPDPEKNIPEERGTKRPKDPKF
jgi:hypothetical protein